MDDKTVSEKTCCIFNLAPHYNEAIYTLMDQELKCDFYIGDRVPYPIEVMRYENLKHFKKRLKFIPLIGDFYWQQGALKLAFKPYRHYILSGEPHCVSSWLIMLSNRVTGRKSYLWSHGWYGNERGLKKIFKKLFFGLSHRVFLYGHYARNLMIEAGIKPEKLVILYNSLDYDAQIRIRKDLKNTLIYKQHFKNEYPVLLYIGRIQSRKKIGLLIEALNNLRNGVTACNLILIGKETDETDIHQLVTLHRLEKHVWFFGPSYDEHVLGELIYNSDVCVSPGNVGLTAIHSLVYGTPVITQDNFRNQMPEFEAIKPGTTGDFFLEDSVEDLVVKIKKWIALPALQRDEVRQCCYEEIDQKYNPNKQIYILKETINIL